MRVTLLGTGQLHPADRVQCGTLLEDHPLLIDCGAGVYQRLYDSPVSVDELQHVLFTHLHQDHVSDIVPIINAKQHAGDRPFSEELGRRDGFDGPPGLTIHGPPGTKRLLRLLARAHMGTDSDIEFPVRTGSLHLSVEEITPGETFSVDGRTVETHETKHADNPTMAYRFGEDLVVSGDTDALDSVAEFADGVRVLIHECTFFDGRDSDGHTTPGGLGEILAGRDIDEVYLTHLPEHTPEERRATLEAVREAFDGNVTVTQDMQRVSTVPESAD